MTMRLKILPIILAGGQASRLEGRCKLLLPLYEEKTVLDYLHRLLQTENYDDIYRINVNDSHQSAVLAHSGFRAIRVFADDKDYLGAGPLAGFLASLKFATHHHYDAIFTLASDTPFLPTGIIKKFADYYHQHADKTTRPTIISAQSKTGNHPIISLLPSNLAVPLAQYLQNGDFKIANFFRQYDWHFLNFDPDSNHHDHDAFFNINNHADWQTAQKLCDKLPLID